jgi:NAD-dependent deacetylase
VREARNSDVALSVGTSSSVWPAAGIPLEAAAAGAFTIEVNPEETELSRHFDVSLRGPAGRVLPELLARTLELRGAGEVA